MTSVAYQERVDTQILERILQNWNTTESKCRFVDARKNYEVIKDSSAKKTILEKYISLKKKNKPTNYKSKKCHPYERLWACEHSLQNIARQIRHTLCKDTMWDIDVANCHPSILLYLSEKENIPHELLSNFINGRTRLISEMMEEFDISKDCAKHMILSIFNGGKIDDQFKKENIPVEIIPKWLIDLQNELSFIEGEILKKHIYKHHLDKAKKIKQFNPTGSAINHLFCEFERKIIDIVKQIFTQQGWEIAADCFDGVMVYKNEKLSLVDTLCLTNEALNRNFNFNFKVVEKPMDEALDLTGMTFNVNREVAIRDELFKKYLHEEKADWTSINVHKTSAYLTACYDQKIDPDPKHITEYVNYYCGYIRLKKSCYVALTWKDGRRIDFKLKTRETFLQDLENFGPVAKMYMENINKKVWEGLSLDLDYNEEHTFFNTFSGLKIRPEDCPSEEEISDGKVMEAIQPALDHCLKIICNGNQEVNEHLLNYMAGIIKGKDMKISITVISLPGTGKDMFFVLLFGQGIIGDGSFLDVHNISNVVGEFNSAVEGKIFMVFNDCTFKGNHTEGNFIKNLITAPNIRITHKGLEAYYVPNISNVITLSNSENVVKIESGDRRHMVIEANNKYAGDKTEDSKKYFDKLAEVDPRMFATFLYRRNIDNWDETFLPKTEIRKQLEIDNYSDGDDFIYNYFFNYDSVDHFNYNRICKYTDEEILELDWYVADIYNCYTSTNPIRPISIVMFSKKLKKMLKITDMKIRKERNHKNYLKTYFRLERGWNNTL